MIPNQNKLKIKMSSINECCICYETIGENNNCTTECGHKFCLKCIILTMKSSTVCPCCRFSLREDEDECDDEDDEEYEEEEEEEEEEESDDEIEIETFVKKFEDNGLTLLEIASVFMGLYSKKLNQTQKEEIESKVDNIIEEVYREHDDMKKEEEERTLMAAEDKI